jgi:hypothetical protein
MKIAISLLLLAGLYPWWRARNANWATSLAHAIHWGIAAWLAWLATAFVSLMASSETERTLAYLALCLTGCAGVAVLGARRPGVGAWSFVVVGLLAIQTLPLFEGLDRLRNSPLRAVFLCATVAVLLLNYLPTRLAPAALLVGVGMAPELLRVIGPESWMTWLERIVPLGWAALAIAPWAAWLALRIRHAAALEVDRVWLAFRDRYGFIWAQRMREQFNRAVANAGWPVHLGWSGLQQTSGNESCCLELANTLQALLRRFGPDYAAEKQDH